MEDKPWTKYWIKEFQEDPTFGSYRFKKLDRGYSGYPPFDLGPLPVDIVDCTTFCANEEDRLPLVIGTQFGLYPRIHDIPNFFDDDKLVAVLSRSILSGTVFALKIYLVGPENTAIVARNRVRIFKNGIGNSEAKQRRWPPDYPDFCTIIPSK